MSATKNWMPGKRAEQLTFAQNWVTVLREDTAGAGSATVKKYEAWGIPAATFTDFVTLFAAAQEALRLAQEKETRTEVTNAQCRAAFAALVAAMRDMKDRHFKKPPLTDADFIALGLKPADKKPTPSGPPTARILPEIVGRGQASFTLRFEYVEGNPNDSANKARRLYYKIIARGETPPATPNELTQSRPMCRKKEEFRLEYGDSGNTVFMAVQLENGDMKGPFGPMISAVIP